MTVGDRVLGGAGALVGAAALAFGATAVLRHDRARGEYEAHARALGSTRYDAATSDAHYDAVLAGRRDADRAGAVAAVGALLVGVAVGRRKRAIGRDAPLASRGAHAALAIDAAITVGAGLLIASISRWLGAERAALAGLLEHTLLGVLAAVVWASHARGRSGGAWLLGLRVTDAHGARPGLGRALACLALAPLALIASAVTLGAIRGHAQPLHTRWLGLRAVRERELDAEPRSDKVAPRHG